jgi:hypothetical protein
LAPTDAQPPASVLDLVLPAGFGGASITSGSGDATGGDARSPMNVGGTPDNHATGLVTVTLVRPLTTELPGVIAVSVPQDIVASGKGFSFPLPVALVEAAATDKVQVTLTNGKRLPSWLRYVRGTHSFVASAAPAGALPITVVISIGTRRWTVQIAAAR